MFLALIPCFRINQQQYTLDVVNSDLSITMCFILSVIIYMHDKDVVEMNILHFIEDILAATVIHGSRVVRDFITVEMAYAFINSYFRSKAEYEFVQLV